MTTILWALFYVLSPAFILVLTHKSRLAARIGAIVLAYALGLIVGNIGVLPDSIAIVHDAVTTITVPLALPLLFFSFDLSRWRSLAAVAIRALVAGLIAVTIGSGLTYLIFSSSIGPDTWKIAGMLVGVYTGGTPNLAAIGNALAVDPSTYVSVHGSDVVAGAVLLLLLVGVAPRLSFGFLPRSRSEDRPEQTVETYTIDFRVVRWRDVRHMAMALSLALLIVAIGASATLVLPETIALPITILAITTLGVLASFSRKVRSLRRSYSLGYYFILVFSVTVSSMADLRELALAAPIVLAYVATLLVLVLAIHLLLSRAFGVDRDTHIITVTSLVFSPPFVPVVAAALGNRRVVLAGILIGVVGWIIGNYLGLALAYTLRLFV